MRVSHLFLAATLSVSPMAFVSQAQAFDSSSFMQKLESALEADGADVTFGDVASEGEALTVRDFVIKDQKTGNSSTIGTLTFVNAEDSGNGGFSYDSLQADTVVLLGKHGTKAEIETLSSTGLEFAGTSKEGPLPSKADSLQVSNIKISNTKNPDQFNLTIPSIAADGYERTTTRNFILKGAEIAPFQGRVFNTQGEPIDINFSGASISDFEYFGLFGLDIGKINIGSFSLDTVGSQGPINFAFQGAEMENYYSWDPSDETRSFIPDDNLSFEFKPLEIKAAGKTLLSWNGAKGIAENDQENKTSKSKVDVDAITFDAAAIKETGENAQTLKTLNDLGYEQISISISIEGLLDLKNGLLNIQKAMFDFKDAGSFDMSLNVSGYTEQVAKSIASAASSIQNSGDPQAQQAQMLQLMAMFAPLSLQQMELKVTDASLLGKVLDLQASRTNRTAQELAAVVPPMAGIMLAPLQVPELASALSSALGTFMQGNKSIAARIEPAGGLAVTEMLALGSGARAGSIPPADIVNRLNLKIEAE